MILRFYGIFMMAAEIFVATLVFMWIVYIWETYLTYRQVFIILFSCITYLFIF